MAASDDARKGSGRMLGKQKTITLMILLMMMNGL